MAKQMIDIKPGKGFSNAQSNEHLRKYSEGAYQNLRSNNFDPTRAHLDFEITKGGRIVPLDDKHSIPQRIREIIDSRGVRDPNEGLEKPRYKTVANIILGGSRDQMRRLAFGAQNVNFTYGSDNSNIVREKGIEQWAIDSYNFIAKRFGEENIVAFAVHLDETNPHVHCTLLPINEKNRFSWISFFGNHKEEGRKIFRELHDEFAKVNAKYGLERGDDIRVTGAKHRTTEEYKQWLWEECNKLEKEADGKRRVLRMFDDEIRRAQIKVKGLTTMINNLNKQKNDLLREISDLQKQHQNGKISVEELNRKTEELNAKVKDIEKKILDKENMLDDAKKQLQDINIKKAATNNEIEDLQIKLNRDLPKWQDKIMNDIDRYGWKQAALDMKSQLEEKLTEDEMDNVNDALDGSMFDMMANSASEVIATATALFFGYLEQATQISQSCGGGGNPGSGWERDDYDNDDKWAKKCFHTACRMMRKPQRRKFGWRR